MKPCLAIILSLMFLCAAFGCEMTDEADVDDDMADDDDAVDDDDNDDFSDDDVTDDDDDVMDDDDDDVADDDDDDVSPITGCVQGDFDPYTGVVHAHTRYSDGAQLPEDAFEYARDVANIDILIITDHLESLYIPVPPGKYGKCKDAADQAYDPGVFLADCGFEYSSGFDLQTGDSSGHNNVFFSPWMFAVAMFDFHNFYKFLTACNTCVGQFNHPNYNEPHKTWNGWEYFEDVDWQMNLFEFNTGQPWEAYYEALSAGWHLSPVYNQDNHGPDWGTKNDRLAGFFLGDLTRDDLHFAMMARISFAAYDRTAYIKVMADQTCWMGSILTGYTQLPFDVEVVDPEGGDGFDRIELYDSTMTLLDTYDCQDQDICTASYDLAVNAPDFFIATAYQTDGDWLVAAPVWVE